MDGIESRECYRNLAPQGEPQLGRRGLYRLVGGDDAGRERELALLWLLNLSDGDHSLEDIADRSGAAPARLREAADALLAARLLALE
jgi:aminopeptidase-like protein